MGKLVGHTFGDEKDPLLVSVRSGARASMPGMMDTVLNLGLNDKTVEVVAARADKRFAYDSYRRFVQMYGHVVLDIEGDLFEEKLGEYKEKHGYNLDTDMTGDDWAAMVETFKAIIQKEMGKPFPQDPKDQLWGAIGAVFGSWMGARAVTYRRIHELPGDWGTAVNVQAMVFGNTGENSATGVAFTRNPATGERALYGEFLVNAQGEDVVAGIRTPQDITEAARKQAGSDAPLTRNGDARGVQEVRRLLQRPREALSRHAGHGVHDRGRPPVDAADPQRQAHHQGGPQDRHRHGRRRADHQGRGGAAHRAGRPRPAASPDHRPEGEARPGRHRPAGLARRGFR